MQFVIDLTPIIERLDRIEAKLDELQTRDTGKNIFNTDEAAAYLGVSKSHLYKLVHTRRLPCHKPTGRRLFFKRSDLDAYATTGRVCSNDEIDVLARKWLDKNPMVRRTGRRR